MKVEHNGLADIPQRSLGKRAPAAMRDPVLAVDRTSLLSYARALPVSVGEAQRKHGLDIFDQMQRDGAIEAGIRKWKQEVLSAEFRVVAPPGYEKDAALLEQVDFLKRQIDNLDQRIEDFAWQCLDAGIYGHALIEPLWTDGGRGEWSLKQLRVVPPRMYVLVQDAYGRFLGAIGWIPGHIPLLWEGPLYLALQDIPGFIPAWRFALHSHNARAGNVAGRSRLESAYNPYRLKHRNWPLYLQALVRFSGIKPIGVVGPDVQSVDPNKTPEQELSEVLGGYEESQALGLPPGTNVLFAQNPGLEKTYTSSIDACNREMFLSILGSAKTVMEAKNDSQAAQGAAQDAVDEDISFTAASLCATITRQIFKPLVRANWGPEAVCPWLILGSDIDEFVERAPGTAALYSAGAVADNQEADLARGLGLEPPDVPLSVRRTGVGMRERPPEPAQLKRFVPVWERRKRR